MHYITFKAYYNGNKYMFDILKDTIVTHKDVNTIPKSYDTTDYKGFKEYGYTLKYMVMDDKTDCYFILNSETYLDKIKNSELVKTIKDVLFKYDFTKQIRKDKLKKIDEIFGV